MSNEKTHFVISLLSDSEKYSRLTINDHLSRLQAFIMSPSFLSADYWNERYLKQATGWDIGHISDPLKMYFDQLTDKDIRILIPGAGNAYEARYLADKGFTNITVIDIAPSVTATLQASLTAIQQKRITVLTGNFFEHKGSYDLIIEQTFFCAIDPSLRKKYIEKVKSLLTGNGRLVGLLFNRGFENGPPFGGSEEEYRQLFSSSLRIRKLEACFNSIPPRAGTELFVIMENNSKR